MQIDALDRELLELLSDDARLPTAVLARRIGLSRTTVQSRVQRLERMGVIQGYTIRRGPVRGSEPLHTHVMISRGARHAASVEAGLRRLPAVRAVYSVSGAYDLVAIIETESVEQADAAIDKIAAIEGVDRTNSMLILSTRFRAEP